MDVVSCRWDNTPDLRITLVDEGYENEVIVQQLSDMAGASYNLPEGTRKKALLDKSNYQVPYA